MGRMERMQQSKRTKREQHSKNRIRNADEKVKFEAVKKKEIEKIIERRC